MPVTNNRYNDKQLYNKVVELVIDYTFSQSTQLSSETRLGEDLHLVGDDACEFLSDFAGKFDVDMSKMKFTTYFPQEATFEMYYYMATVAQRKKGNMVVEFFRRIESKFWRLFIRNVRYQSISIRDLVEAAAIGRWDN